MTGRFAFAPLRGVGSRGILDFLSPDTSAPPPDELSTGVGSRTVRAFLPPGHFHLPARSRGRPRISAGTAGSSLSPPGHFRLPARETLDGLDGSRESGGRDLLHPDPFASPLERLSMRAGSRRGLDFLRPDTSASQLGGAASDSDEALSARSFAFELFPTPDSRGAARRHGSRLPGAERP